MIIVTAAIIQDQGKLLIAQRKAGAHLALKWEFPGGKVEEGEHPEDCLKREIAEELGIKIEVGNIFKVVSHKYESKHILLLCYLCNYLEGTVTAKDCHDFRWIWPRELRGYDFAEADLPVVELLLKEI